MNLPPNQKFNTNQCIERFFAGRTPRWIRDTFTDGGYGPVFRDAGGWLISGQAINEWHKRHEVKAPGAVPLRSSQTANLFQNQ